MRPSLGHRSGLVAGMLIVGLLAGVFGNLEPARAAGSVIYVVPGGAGTRDGLSWANARDLQAALTAAVAPAELWVKAGTYTPTTDVERTATFALKNGVTIYGGFAGTETALSERKVADNVTTLSGEIGPAGIGDDSYHVVTGSGTDATAILDGFTITGGYADGAALNSRGGGIFNVTGSPTLANLTISGNEANYGGGLYNDNSSPVLTNVTISGNWGDSFGGGMVNEGSSNPTLTNVTISGNTADSFGGGLYNDNSSPVLTNVTISGNTATDEGGGLYNDNSSPVVRNSIVWGNPGGALVNNSTSTPDVQYSLVEGSYAGTGNLSADPRFVSAVPPAPSTGGDLHLQAGSPAINAGSNAALPPGVTTDRDGNPRVALTVDMGAFEHQQVSHQVFLPLVRR